MQIGLGIGTTFRQKWVPSLTEQIRSLLFSASEQGAFYDPSDMSTLFQDAAGTTPVTAVEQPVGLMLDLSGRGNHALQATTTKRPVYSRRVNLLTKTEQFDDPVWVKIGVSVAVESSGGAGFLIIPSAESDPHILQQTVGVPSGAVCTLSIKAKKAGYRYFYFAQLGGPTTGSIFDFDTGTYGVTTGTGATYSAELLPDGFWLLSMTFTTGAGITSVITEACASPVSYFAGFAGDGVSGALIKDASLATDAHLPYQRVNTATDYDADPAKFPAYLRFDGVDDAMQTGNIDFTGTGDIAVFAGSLAGVNSNWLVNHNDANPGSFRLLSVVGGTYWNVYAQPSGAGSTSTLSGGGIANAVNVTSFTASVAQKSLIFRNNFVSINPASAPSWNGAFGNAPLTIGARENNTLFFEGRLYSLIVRGAQSSLSQVEATELYIKQKMRMP